MELPRLTPHERELVERTLAAARAYVADRRVPLPRAHDLAVALIRCDGLLRCAAQRLLELQGAEQTRQALDLLRHVDPEPPRSVPLQ